MKCLTSEEVSQWIRETKQIENPYTGNSQPVFRIQFSAPEKYQAIECFLRCFLNEILLEGEMLIVVTDSEPSEQCQKFINEAVRHSFSEIRLVEEAPGYRAQYQEKEQAIALFSIMTCFGWKCYLYGSHDQIILYNWEGEIFDVWTSSEFKKNEVLRIIRSFELEEITT